MSLGRALSRCDTGADAVRGIDVIAPTRSKVFVPDAGPMTLSGSEWAFEGRAL